MMESIISVLTLNLVLFLSGLDTAPVQNSSGQNSTVDAKDLEYAEPEATLNEKSSAIFGSADDISDFNNFNVSSRVKRMGSVPQCGVDDSSNYGTAFKWGKTYLTYHISNSPANVSPITVQQLLKRAFDEWSKATNLEFREVQSHAADINIGFGYSQHNNRHSTCNVMFASNVLAHAFYPQNGEIHFNSVYYFDSHGTDDFFTTAVHEIGHALGLDHMHSPDSVMYPYFVRNFNALPTLDQENIQMMYGKRLPPLPVRQQNTNNHRTSNTPESWAAADRIANSFGG